MADLSRWAGSAGACHLRETHRFISRVDPASGGARRRWFLGRVALSGEPGTLDSPTTLTPSSSASRPAHPDGGGVDIHNAPGSPASGADAERASGRLAAATMAPVAVSGLVIAVAIVAEWAIDDADASAPPAHPWTARPCMKNNPQRTAPTATRRAVARAEAALPVTVSPVAVPSAGAAHGTHASPISGSSPGQKRGGVPSNLLRKTAPFDADHMELAGVSWPCPPFDGGGRYAGHVTVVILGTTVPIDRYP